MATLAPQFGISDVALKKTCAKHRIPTPPRGYWARKAAGQSPRRVALPKLPEVAAALVATIEFLREPKVTARELAEATGPVADQERFEARPDARIVVPETLDNPHPLVAATVKALRAAKPNEQHVLRPRARYGLDVHVSLGSADRAMCILDAALKALDTRGYQVSVTEQENGSVTSVLVGQERIAFSLRETVSRVERPSPERRKRTPEPFYEWSKSYDYVPTGRLALQLEPTWLGVRRTWSDGAKQRLEECLHDFIVGLVAAAEALRTQRLKREEDERKRQAEAERRAAAERVQQREEARIRAMRNSLEQWQAAATLRRYAIDARTAAHASGLLETESAMSRYLAWLDEYIDRIDPFRGTPEVPTDPKAVAWSWQPREERMLW
jgi:hypothetical protein